MVSQSGNIVVSVCQDKLHCGIGRLARRWRNCASHARQSLTVV